MSAVRPERVVVDTWDTGYGISFDPDDELAAPSVDLNLEVEARDWAPLDVDRKDAAAEVLFIDGVQQVDARLGLIEGNSVVPALAGSYAAGSVRSARSKAVIEEVNVDRGLFTLATDVEADCGSGVRYPLRATTDVTDAGLVRNMTDQMRALERDIAHRASAELVVVDGPLTRERPVAAAVGLVKTHRRAHLPEEQQQTVARLRAGQRTPLFLTTTGRFSRYSWYLRLPGPGGHPWAGVVRCEAANDLTPSDVIALANRVTATLPRFASSPHRDPRAPQNLTPIGELERILRHRLGDVRLLERMLRRWAGSWSPPQA